MALTDSFATAAKFDQIPKYSPEVGTVKMHWWGFHTHSLVFVHILDCCLVKRSRDGSHIGHVWNFPICSAFFQLCYCSLLGGSYSAALRNRF